MSRSSSSSISTVTGRPSAIPGVPTRSSLVAPIVVPSKVLVTGGSGFIASHIIFQLAADGYNVRTTVRSKGKYDNYLASIVASADDENVPLEIVELDLLEDNQIVWDNIVEGCDYVIHAASPFVMAMSEEDLIRSAVNGTQKIMNAVANAKHPVKKTVVTSSIASIAMGHKQMSRVLDEDSWSIEAYTKGYEKSKMLAEKAAWKIAHEKKILLETVCPGLVLGPVLGKHNTTCQSSEYIMTLITNANGIGVDIRMPVTDVRDVAEVHVRALTHGRLAYEDLSSSKEMEYRTINSDDSPVAKARKELYNKDAATVNDSCYKYGVIHGNRYICASDDAVNLGLMEISECLTEFVAEGGSNYKPTSWKLPNWFASAVARLHPMLAPAKYWIGFTIPCSTVLPRRVLNMKFRPWKGAAQDHALSLMKMGFLDANGYDEVKIKAFCPYDSDMTAWKAYVEENVQK